METKESDQEHLELIQLVQQRAWDLKCKIVYVDDALKKMEAQVEQTRRTLNTAKQEAENLFNVLQGFNRFCQKPVFPASPNPPPESPHWADNCLHMFGKPADPTPSK